MPPRPRIATTAATIFATFFLGLTSIVTAEEPVSSANFEFFEKEVRPLLVEHCLDCHSPETDVSGGLSLNSRENLLAGGDTGPAIVSGKPAESLLIEAVGYRNRDLQMPPDGRMDQKKIDILVEWVKRGAPDPRVATTEIREQGPSGMSIEEGRRFWSFQPVDRPNIPEVAAHEWVASPIDAFVLARLERNGWTPAPPADKRTLIRRLTFNLTGLPPTPEEVETFVNNDSPEAYGQLVNRLLESPQYGVHWGRHWLDVARYADSNGLDENLAYGLAWRYRDYVVDAFNADKPYDRFVIEQLAGDLMPHASQETRIATGFLALGAKVLAEPDRVKLEMDVIDEQLDTTGKAFMGLTLGCVRCHDHKFDPIKQRDYYALAAIFKSTKTLGDTNTGAIKHWYEHSFATDEHREQLKQVNARVAELKRAASTFKNRAISNIREQAQRQAADYLARAALVTPRMSLNEIAEIAEPLGLHPRILHHCRLHLDYHRDDPLFVKWHAFVKAGELEALREHYEALFAAAAVTDSESGAENRFAGEQIELARAALKDKSGFLALPTKEEHAFDTETLAGYYELLDAARAYESQAMDEPAAMGVTDGAITEALPIHIRGSYKNLGEPIAREFPEVMWQSSHRPIFPSQQSGRLQFARWVASTRHPLTARVMVNRVWGWHFGQPLVATTENFGTLGAAPSHPELLDWLAYEFMKSGWSIKALHRLILNSNTYRMSALHPQADSYAATDQENRLLWRANLKRLPAESIRDAMLAVSGRLDDSLGGKTVPLRNKQFVFNHTSQDHTKYDSTRRAIYLPVIRNHLYPFFEQFDFPDPTMPTGHRNTTTVAPQALLLMNSELATASARQFAKRIETNSTEGTDRIHNAFELAYGREPTSSEVARSLEFLDALITSTDANSEEAWVLLCHGLFAANEFIYIR